MTPEAGFGIGMLTALAAAAPGAFVLWKRLRRAERRARIFAEDSELCSELIAAAPDGVFVWTADNRASCSRRLAVLLDLADGVESSFDDARARFTGESSVALQKAVHALRQEGEPFDLVLPATDGRALQVVGARASAADGRWLADAVWMRDVGDSSSRSTGLNAPPAELSDDQEWMAALLDSLPMPVWLRDANLNLVFVNRSGLDEAVADTTRDLAVAARQGQAPAAEHRLLSLGGLPRLYEVTEAPLGNWPGTLGYAIDRSAAEEMEGTFARDTAAREQVFESLNTAIAIFDSKAKLVFSNSNYAALWGLDAQWLGSEPTLAEVLERLRELRRLPEFVDFRLFKEEQLALFGALKEPVEELLHLPSGATFRCLINPYPLGGLVFIYEDVTERLALERSLNTLIAVQRETLDNLYEGVAVFGSDGRLKLFNPVFAKLWKLNAGDLEGEPHVNEFVERTKPLIAGTVEGDWETHKERVIARLMGREPHTGRIVRADGTILDYANVPLPDGAVLLSYLDVTDRTRLEEALRQRAEALHEADRLKSEFIANVAHEVRTPMNTIIGFADILTEEYFGPLNTRQAEYVRGILETSQNLISVVSDILDLATIEAGILTLSLDTIDLSNMLVASLQLVRDRARRKNQQLEFDGPSDLGWIVADEKRLRQVLFNLLSNAVNFTPPRGRIKLTARRSESEVEISVTDTGVGIPLADQERMFRSFERGPAMEGEARGAGLGLSLVKRFVELHGGRVEIKSRPNRGTTVVCRLPAGGAPVAEPVAVTATPAAPE